MLWDMVMMAIVWVVWNERNNKIFNHRALSIYELVDYVFHFVDFWAGHMSPTWQRKVDTTVITYASKKCRELNDGPRGGDSSQCGAIACVDGGGILLGPSDGRNAEISVYMVCSFEVLVEMMFFL